MSMLRTRARSTRRLGATVLAVAVTAMMLSAGVAESAAAAPAPGAKCKKVGKTTDNGLVCKRKKGRLVFVRIPATSTPTAATPAPAAPTSPEFTAAEKETIKNSFATALPGKKVDRTFSDANGLTQLIWHFCPSNRYGLVSNLTFTNSGSTTSTEIGTWTISDAGGIRNQVEAVLIQMKPDDPSISPYALELDALVDGTFLANNRRAFLSPTNEC